MNMAVVIAFLEFIAQEVEANISNTTAQNIAVLAEKWLPEISAVFPAIEAQIVAIIATLKGGKTLSADEILALRGLIGSLKSQSDAVDAQIAAGN